MKKFGDFLWLRGLRQRDNLGPAVTIGPRTMHEHYISYTRHCFLLIYRLNLNVIDSKNSELPKAFAKQFCELAETTEGGFTPPQRVVVL